jgi:hypothetical protein
MILSFEESTHTYKADGKPVPSVTQILKAGGLTGQYRGTTARDRGTKIHKSSEVYDNLDVIIDDDTAPYVRAWKQFCDQNEVEILASEQPVFSEQYWYAGTLDRIVRIKGNRIALLDIKSGTKADWHRLQLAAYEIAACEYFWQDRIDCGLVVYLKPEKYSVTLYNADHMTAAKNHWLQIRSIVK